MCGVFVSAASLEENSPFIPFDQPVRPPAFGGPQKGGVELRGIMEFSGEQTFSLYNPTTKESRWVMLQERSGPYFVESYDPKAQSVSVVINGAPQQLKLNKPSDTVLPVSKGNLLSRSPGGPPSPSRFPHEDERPSEGEIDPEQRKEMADKVYSAFKKYVAEKKARAESELDDDEGED